MNGENGNLKLAQITKNSVKIQGLERGLTDVKNDIQKIWDNKASAEDLAEVRADIKEIKSTLLGRPTWAVTTLILILGGGLSSAVTVIVALLRMAAK